MKTSLSLLIPLSLFSLVVAGGVLLAAPCYTRSGGSVGCWSQGGSVCSSILPTGLSCPGGPWYASTPGVDINDQCEGRHVEHPVPKDYSSSGNEPSGYSSLGVYRFHCTSTRTCSKQIYFNPHLTVQCSATPLSVCNKIDVHTAGGSVCPIAGSGAGGGGGE